MPWLLIILGYLLGSIPTAYIAGRHLRNQDIRRIGDGNMGAANAFRELGPAAGIIVGVIDAAKGVLVILLARAAGVSLPFTFLAGLSVLIGHNFPVFLGFRGGRGESSLIGELLVLMPQPMLIMAIPAVVTLVLSHNVVLTSAVLFVPVVLLSWWFGITLPLIAFCVALMIFVALTHFYRTKLTPVRVADKSYKAR